MREVTLEAKTAIIPEATAMVEEILEEAGCPMKIQLQVDVAVDEIISNIANYAYAESSGTKTEASSGDGPVPGTFTIRVELEQEPQAVWITFIDSGKPYNPLEKDDPDVTLSLAERQIGGLGIFLVKKTMDKMTYERREGKNILRIMKRF